MTTKRDRTLIVFGEDWGSHPSSTQHIVLRLLDRWQVVWVNSIGLRRPRVSLHDIKRLWTKLWAKNTVEPADNGIKPDVIISPRTLPFPGSKLADRINIRLLAPKIRAACQQLGDDNPVLWISLVSAAPFIDELNECAVAYYCGDDFGALAGVDHKPIMDYESHVIAQSSLVMAASPYLANKFEHKNIQVVPHGADISLFANDAPTSPHLPTGRCIGFYGSISSWLDQALLVHCMTALPDVTFCFVGKPHTDISALQACPNAVFIGEVAHNELPSFSQHWDVSILPFLDNAQIRACNPLKLREYLAAGKPVVTTDFPALDGYRDLVHIANDQNEFLAHLQRLLDEPDTRRDARRDRVAQETWDARANQVHELLMELM